MKIVVVNGRRLLLQIRFFAFVMVLILLGVTVFNVGYKAYGSYIGTSSQADAEPPVIIIDAGHGGEDPGAVGVNGVYEKDLNLEIAMILADILRERGYTVVLTRTTDKMLYSEEENIKGMRKLSDLKNRCKVTEEYPDGILVSIHMNSFGQSKYSGLQVYYTDGNDDSRLLAGIIQSTVKSELQNDNNRVIKSGKNMFLLEKSKCTSVLIECGFLTNSEECRKLSEKEYQKQLSFSIACGIIEYINKN